MNYSDHDRKLNNFIKIEGNHFNISQKTIRMMLLLTKTCDCKDDVSIQSHYVMYKCVVDSRSLTQKPRPSFHLPHNFIITDRLNWGD